MSNNFRLNPKKEKLKRIASETIDVINNGKYRINSRFEVDVTVGDSYLYELTNKIDSALLSARRPSNLKVTLSKDTTYGSITKYRKNNPSSKIVVLNFASAKNPGGGFLNGSSAQEESLARVSGLYKSLYRHKEFYEKSKKNPNNGLYYDLAIYSKYIPFIRDCDNEEIFIEPLYCDVITCAAVNRGVAIKSKVSEDVITLTMLNRIKTVIELFIKESDPSRKNILILGAFGCGVFKNNPSTVAKAFNYVFDYYKDELSELDLEINFSIPDDSNYFEFKRWI